MRAFGRGLLIAFVAGLAGYVTWDRLEVYRLDRAVKAIAARGEPIDLSSAEPVPSNAQEQEAAQLYAAAAARAREMIDRDARLTRVDVDAVVGRVDVADIEETFRKDAPALQLLDRATPLPFAGFGDGMDSPDWTEAARLQALAALACLRTDLLAYRGDGDAAAASLVAAVRVQRTLRDLFYVTQTGVRQLGSLRILLRHSSPSDAALQALQRAFAETPDEDLIERDLMLRRARFIESTGDVLGQPGLPWLLGFVFHPFLVRTERVQLEQYPDVLLAARTPWPDKIGALAALAESPANRVGRTSVRRILFGPPLNVAALTAAPVYAGLRLASRRLALATLAIERYRRAHGGQPPPDMSALVPAYLAAVPIDPFSGAPFVYRPSPEDYLLYSVDFNRKDDGGQLYGTGSLNPMPSPRLRDLGLRVPLAPHRSAQ
jgi:hypothetical protein